MINCYQFRKFNLLKDIFAILPSRKNVTVCAGNDDLMVKIEFTIDRIELQSRTRSCILFKL